jgi:hypothetical protein
MACTLYGFPYNESFGQLKLWEKTSAGVGPALSQGPHASPSEPKVLTLLSESLAHKHFLLHNPRQYNLSRPWPTIFKAGCHRQCELLLFAGAAVNIGSPLRLVESHHD